MVVILATYSASLTANLTVSRVKGGVTGIADLPGKAVGTWDPYVDQLKQYNVFSTPYAWENTEDEKIMVQDLLDRKVVAFVLDNVRTYMAVCILYTGILHTLTFQNFSSPQLQFNFNLNAFPTFCLLNSEQTFTK